MAGNRVVTQSDIEHSMISRSESMLFTELDQEVIMMNLEQGSYFGLDDIATRVWDLLESAQTVDQLCNQLLKEYEVSVEQCRKDLMELLKSMEEAGMIKIGN